MRTVEEKRQHEISIVSLMIELYCHGKHHTKKHHLCKECEELKNYAILRTEKCPFMATKTFCSQCKVHCYSPIMKERIREVMRYSGPRMIFHHPIIAFKHVYYVLKDKKKNKKK